MPINSLRDAEKILMSSGQHRFVFLHFVSGSDEGFREPIPLLIVHGNGKLQIHIAANWESRLNKMDRDYLDGLQNDWRNASTKEIPAILDQLAELSVGPLRTVEAGTAGADMLNELLQQLPGNGLC